MADGTVDNIGKSKVYGNYVIIKSSINYNNKDYIIKIRYSHLSLIYCKKNDILLQGDKFAVLGNTGRTNKTTSYNGVHLDLEININGVYVNPFNNTIWHKRVEL
jgi:murein DD-endopeptidase MepM/ murein hydrolase activator NlpD